MWETADFGSVAATFPGAGIRPTGFEVPFYENNRRHLGPPLDRASEFAGVDLSAALGQDRMDSLSERDTQLFTYGYSLGVMEVLRNRGVQASLIAGHSLGVYAALCAAGCVTFEAGLELVDRAYSLARSACSGLACGMIATAGLTLAEVDGILARLTAPSLRRVIVNSSRSMVVAGETGELERFHDAAKDADATRLIWLDRNVAYHHPALLSAASERFAETVRNMPWKNPVIPLVSSLDATRLTTVRQTRDFTVWNLSSPIDWQQVLRTFDACGIRTVFESGPGDTLTRMGRFVDVDLKYLNVKKITRRGG